MSDRFFSTQKLEGIVLALKDGTHGTHRRMQQGIPLLSAKNISAFGEIEWNAEDDRISESEYKLIHKNFVLEAGDLLLTIVGTLGRRAIYRGESVTFQRSVAYIRPNTRKVSGRFLFHWFSHPTFLKELVRRSNATAQAGLYLGELAKTSIPDASLQEQDIISNILDSIDTAIRKTEAIIEKLKQIKQGLLHDLLTRGIDANGELRPPPELAPELYKESPLGLIPKEWELRPIESISTVVTSGSRSWASYYSDSGSAFIRIGNLTRDHINLRLDSLTFVNPPKNSDGQRTKLEAGDLLISITADLGIIGVIPENFGEAYINQHIAMVRFEHEKVNCRFVGHFLAGGRIQKIISQLNDSGAKAGLNLPTIRQIMIVIPSKNEQDIIASRLDNVDLRIQIAKTESEKLNRQKTALMNDLLTGQVRVTPLLEGGNGPHQPAMPEEPTA